MDEAERDDDEYFDTSFRSLFDKDLLRRELTARGVHPDDLGALMRYVPVGLTHLCWRNTILEDWHAGPDSKIHDAEMMRANVATTRKFYQTLWSAFGPIWEEEGPYVTGAITPELLGEAFMDALEEVFDPNRLLPHGVELGAIAGEQWEELESHADIQLGSLTTIAEDKGAHIVLMWLALRGRLAVSTWWGTPAWPVIVDEAFRRIDDPGHETWQRWGHPGPLPLPRDELRGQLLNAPDRLDTSVIEYFLFKVGIGYIQV